MTWEGVFPLRLMRRALFSCSHQRKSSLNSSSRLLKTSFVGTRVSFIAADLSSPGLHSGVEIIQQGDKQVTRPMAGLWRGS